MGMTITDTRQAISHLSRLESESIHIMREIVAECRNPVLLFSGGKDSICLLRIAEKAFAPAGLPFPLLHIDTGHNFPEVMDFLHRRANECGARLISRHLDDSIERGTVRLRSPEESRNRHQSVTLLEALQEFAFDACFGGARRDEEKARAKERICSFRDEFGQWDPKHQRPELWSLYNTRILQGEHLRVFPISNWTELDIWNYIQRERLEVPTIYFSHMRKVALRGNSLISVTELTPAGEDDPVEVLPVRFRSVGDITCTSPIRSDARTVEAIIAETIVSRITERGDSRLDDRSSDSSMEQRKKEGYF